MQVAKVGAGGVGAAKAGHVVVVERLAERGEIVGWYHAVAVEEDEVVAAGALNAVVARNGAAFVGLEVVLHVEAVGVTFHHVAAGLRGAVLDDEHLEVLARLLGQAGEQVVHLVDAIIYWNNDGEHYFQL